MKLRNGRGTEDTEAMSAEEEMSEGFLMGNRLPQPFLSQLMFYLGDQDRCNASATCSSWREAFKYPTLWRQRHFAFHGYDAAQQSERHQTFVTTLGYLLHEVTLHVSRPTIGTATILARSFEQFVNTLNNAGNVRLLKLRLKDLNFHARWRNFAHNRDIMLEALCSLVKKQTSLQVVDLSGSLMDRDEGSRLLSALSYGTRSRPKQYLRELNLQNFFTARTRAASFVPYSRVMGQFPALVSLKMDFRSLNANILQTLTNAARTLLELHLDYSPKDAIRGQQTISSEVWQTVTARLPDLRVSVCIHGLGTFSAYCNVLVENVPLNALSLRYLNADTMPTNAKMTAIPNLLHHLGTHFSPTLSRVYFKMPANLDLGADAEVVRLVRLCSFLRQLNLDMVVEASTVLRLIEEIKKQQSTGRVPDVTSMSLHLNVRNMTPELDSDIRQRMASAGFFYFPNRSRTV